jgi:3-ketosteroid 9alpha-monooxygenase subunit A
MIALQPTPMKHRAPDTNFPKGWYVVADSDDVTASALLPLSYLDQELIAYRDTNGKAHVADAYCPHMGAHLASHDGCVAGGKITCPFHKWAFDGESGRCESIPYSKVMVPESVKLTVYPTREIDGMVAMWYHPAGEAPDHEPFEREQIKVQGSWYTHIIKDLESTCPFRDLFENLFDTAHVQQLHHSNGLPEICSVERTGYGLDVRFGPPTAQEQFPITSMQNHFTGVSMATQLIEGEAFGFMIVTSVTPIDHERFFQRSRLLVRDTGSKEMNQLLGQAFAERTSMEIEQDMKVLNFKKHLTKPALCQGDGPIFRWRRYQEEFYV